MRHMKDNQPHFSPPDFRPNHVTLVGKRYGFPHTQIGILKLKASNFFSKSKRQSQIAGLEDPVAAQHRG